MNVMDLAFADDLILLLVKATVHNARNLRRILMDYCQGIEPQLNTIKAILQAGVREGTLSYLGTPVAGKLLKADEFSFLMDRISSKLNGWKW